MVLFRDVFRKPKPIIGMVHVFEEEYQKQFDQALEDADRLQRGGVDGLLVENYGCGYFDSNRADKRMADRLLKITLAIVQEGSEIPIGINLLPNDYWDAIRAAFHSGGAFVQLDHVTGDFNNCKPVDPKEFCKVRKDYPSIAVLGGIHPKYYTLSNPQCSLQDCAKKAAALADAVVVTGEHTGGPTSLTDLQAVRKAIGKHPIIVGSGLSPANVRTQLSIADGGIVGTAFKRHGVRSGGQIDPELVRQFMDAVEGVRQTQ